MERVDSLLQVSEDVRGEDEMCQRVVNKKENRSSQSGLCVQPQNSLIHMLHCEIVTSLWMSI